MRRERAAAPREPDARGGDEPGQPGTPQAGTRAAKPWSRTDAVIAIAVALLAVACLAPFRARVPYSWDAALLALGVRDLDFAAAQPHAPGYPLYVFAGKAIDLAVGDPATSLVLLSLASHGAVAALTYTLARLWTGRVAALACVLAVASSPILVLHGLVGHSYVPEAAAGAAAAATAWRAAHRRTTASAAWAGLALAAAVGLRPSSLALLAGLAAWLAWRWRGAGWWRRAGAAAGVGAAATMAWLLPALAVGGGWRSFAAANAYQGRTFVLADTVWGGGWDAVARHAATLAGHLGHAMPAAAAALALLLALAVVATARGARIRFPPGAAPMLLAWLLPGAAFFVLVYDGWPVKPDGYLAPLAVPAVLLMGVAVRSAWAAAMAGSPMRAATQPTHARHARTQARPALAVALGALALAAAATPLLWAGDLPERARQVEAVDAWWASWDGAAEANPDALLVTFYAWPYVKLDHPEWTVRAVVPYFDGGETRVLSFVTHNGRDAVPLYVAMAQGTHAEQPIPPGTARLIEIAGHPLAPSGPVLRADGSAEEATMPGGATALAVPAGRWPTLDAYYAWTAPPAAPDDRHDGGPTSDGPASAAGDGGAGDADGDDAAAGPGAVGDAPQAEPAKQGASEPQPVPGDAPGAPGPDPP